MTNALVYLNGRFVLAPEGALSLYDAGFVSGATIVDNARTFRHELFRWPEHLARFRRDCESCYIPLPPSDAELTATARQLVAHNAEQLPAGAELQLVTFATPGPLGVYLGETTNGPPSLGMIAYPLPFARYRRFLIEGVDLAFAGVQSSDPADLLPPHVKHRSRLFWHIAAERLRDPQSPFHCPGAVPVVCGSSGVGDTAIGSILAVIDGAVVRPRPGATQESISVNVIAELCAALGVPVRHESVPMATLGTSETVSELILAGTGFCLAGVRSFTSPDGTRNYPWPGPMFTKLLAAWSDLVGVDIVKQFTATEK